MEVKVGDRFKAAANPEYELPEQRLTVTSVQDGFAEIVVDAADRLEDDVDGVGEVPLEMFDDPESFTKID